MGGESTRPIPGIYSWHTKSNKRRRIAARHGEAAHACNSADLSIWHGYSLSGGPGGTDESTVGYCSLPVKRQYTRAEKLCEQIAKTCAKSVLSLTSWQNFNSYRKF